MSQAQAIKFQPDTGQNVPLGINTKFASPPLSKKERRARALRFRAYLARRQREELYKAGIAGEFKNLCNCGASPVPAFVMTKDGERKKTGAPGKVQLTYYKRQEEEEGAPLVFSWVKKCANPLLCFMDAPKIRFKRSQEVQEICVKMFEKGFNWLFWTFTAPHDLTTNPQEQVKKFSEAKRLLKSGKSWQNFCERYGYIYHLRAVEMTDDSPESVRKSGIHFHHHDISFFKKKLTEEDIKEIEIYIKNRWFECLKKVGICSDEKKDDVLKHGFRLDVPRKPRNKRLSISEVASYISKGASMEITPGIFTKNGKIPDRISHWEVMSLALLRFPALLPRMVSIMRALKGRHWLHYDKGLLEECDMKVKTDEEILKEKIKPVVYEVENKDWREIDKYKSQVRTIDNIIEQCEESNINIDDLSVNADGSIDIDGVFDDVVSVCNFVTGCIVAGYDAITGETLADMSPPEP